MLIVKSASYIFLKAVWTATIRFCLFLCSSLLNSVSKSFTSLSVTFFQASTFRPSSLVASNSSRSRAKTTFSDLILKISFWYSVILFFDLSRSLKESLRFRSISDVSSALASRSSKALISSSTVSRSS